MSEYYESPDLVTESRNPRTNDLDLCTTREVIDTILDEDMQVVPAVQAVAGQIATAVELAVRTLSAGGRIHYVGAGTSGRLGVLDSIELYPTFGVGNESVISHIAGGRAALVQATEDAEDDEVSGANIAREAGQNDLIIGITASGRTSYVRGALFVARERRIASVLVSSNPEAPIATLVDVAILPDTGPEVLTGSTRMKSGTAQKIVLNALSTATMVRLGKTYSNLMVNVVATNDKLRDRMVHLLTQATALPREQCERAAQDANGDLRLALVMLLAEEDVLAASKALAQSPPDPQRIGDPGGVRTAVALLRSS